MKKVAIAIILFSMIFIGSTNAFETKLYSSVSLNTFWLSPKRFTLDSIGQDSLYLPIKGKDSLNVIFNEWLPGGKFGVEFKQNKVSACVELGVRINTFDAKLTGSNTTRYLFEKLGYAFTARRWFAEWHINDYFTLLAGQEYAPVNFSTSNTMLNADLGYHTVGCLFTGPKPMFQLSLTTPENKIEAKLAVIKIDTVSFYLYNNYNISPLNEVKLPKLEGSFKFNIDKLGLSGKVAGGYQTYLSSLILGLSSDISKDSLSVNVTSYAVGANLSLKIWRAILSFNILNGKNLGPYGATLGIPSSYWRITGDYSYVSMHYPTHQKDSTAKYGWKLYNSKATEMAFILNIAPFDFLSFEGGYGIIIGNHEYQPYDKVWNDGTKNAFYAQLNINLLDNLRISPEIGQHKYGNRKGFGEYIYAGLKMGVDF